MNHCFQITGTQLGSKQPVPQTTVSPPSPVPHTTVSPSAVPQTTVSAFVVPHTTVSPVSPVPHTTVSPSLAPNTPTRHVLLQSKPPHIGPHTTLRNPASVHVASPSSSQLSESHVVPSSIGSPSVDVLLPHRTLRGHAFVPGSRRPPATSLLPQMTRRPHV